MILENILHNLKCLNNDIAYIINDKTYTYSEIYKMVCNLYEFMKNNCDNKSPILIYGHKDVSMIVSFISCSFLGLAYIPIDTSIPKNRIDVIIKQANPQLIIRKHN